MAALLLLRTRAALAAVREESTRTPGAGYLWGERDCASLICALCRALGRPVPAYDPYRGVAEGRAAQRALRRYGSLGAGHQAGLAATGRWAPADLPLEDGDVVSVAGRIERGGVLYAPRHPALDLTGITAAGRWWTWQPKGLIGVHTHGLAPSYITRAD